MKQSNSTESQRNQLDQQEAARIAQKEKLEAYQAEREVLKVKREEEIRIQELEKIAEKERRETEAAAA